jgi:hypothetical protein
MGAMGYYISFLEDNEEKKKPRTLQNYKKNTFSCLVLKNTVSNSQGVL